MKIGVALLAGGKSQRMGQDKAQLFLGGNSFLSIIAKELENFDEKLLCAGNPDKYTLEGFDALGDQYPGCGPISGLHAALNACQSQALLAVSCDMPLFQYRLGSYLANCLKPKYHAVVPVTRDGRIHPLCGVYQKKTAGILKEQIMSRHYCMMDALKKMSVYYMEMSQTPYPDILLANINTPMEYKELCEFLGTVNKSKYLNH